MRRAFSSIASGAAPPAVAISARLRGGARSRDAGETRERLWEWRWRMTRGVLEGSVSKRNFAYSSVIFDIIQGLCSKKIIQG